jgi:hypothetical protein
MTRRRRIFIGTWNTLCMCAGAWLLTRSWSEFFGLMFVLESIVVTIEQCWPTPEN